MSPTLLTLPPELRDQILELLFFGAELSTLCKCHRPNPFQRANYGILTANKQLHHEASTVLFRGAVLHLGTSGIGGYHYLPQLTTKTVIPVWSWYVRDRYRDNGTDLEFLRRWQGLEKVRHVEMSLPLVDDIDWWIINPGLGRYLEVCEMVVSFINGLPEVESLTVYRDADGESWMEEWETLRALTTAKLVVLARDGSCGHKS